MEHNTPSTPARKQKVAVLGGDARQQILADMLAKAGYESALFGIDCTGTPTDATRSATVENAVNGHTSTVTVNSSSSVSFASFTL